MTDPASMCASTSAMCWRSTPPGLRGRRSEPDEVEQVERGAAAVEHADEVRQGVAARASAARGAPSIRRSGAGADRRAGRRRGARRGDRGQSRMGRASETLSPSAPDQGARCDARGGGDRGERQGRPRLAGDPSRAGERTARVPRRLPARRGRSARGSGRGPRHLPPGHGTATAASSPRRLPATA